jgi:hypothetical protein
MVAHDDLEGARSLLHAPIRASAKEEPFVLTLPLLAFGTIDWKILSGYEKKRTPASEFLFKLFTQEITDILVDKDDAEELFDRLELLISLESGYLRLQRKLHFWTPIGRYVWKRHGDLIVERLAAYENLPQDHPVLMAGLLGGTQASANQTVEALRQLVGGASMRW